MRLSFKTYSFLFVTFYIIFSNCKFREVDNLPTYSKNKLLNDFYTFKSLLEKIHPNLYLYCSKEKLTNTFNTVQNSLGNKMTEVEFYKLLNSILYQIHCGHTQIELTKNTDSLISTIKGFFPMSLKYIGTSVVVISKNGPLPFGSKIESINDIPIKEIIYKTSSLNYADGANETFRFYNIENNFSFDYYLHYGFQKNFKIAYIDSTKYLKKNIVEATTLNSFSKNDIIGYYKALDIDYDFYTEDDKGVGFLTVNTFSYDTDSKETAFYNFIDNTFNVLNAKPFVKNLILDLRDNSGGNYSASFYLYNYLSNKSIKEFDSIYSNIKYVPLKQYCTDDSTYLNDIEQKIDTQFNFNKHNQSFTGIDSFYTTHNGFNNYYNKNLYILVNQNTFSAASVLATLLQNQKRAIVVGGETGTTVYRHSAGSFLHFELPNTKIKLTIPVFGYYNHLQENNYTKNQCLKPDYKINPSYNDVMHNIDTEIAYVYDSLVKIKN
jgi:hypothetical protein